MPDGADGRLPPISGSAPADHFGGVELVGVLVRGRSVDVRLGLVFRVGDFTRIEVEGSGAALNRVNLAQNKTMKGADTRYAHLFTGASSK